VLTVFRRAGFSLVEVLLSLVITLVVTGAIYSLLLTTQRVTRAQAQQIGLQSTVRAGSFVVLSELGELSTLFGGTPEQNDILAITPSALTYRAQRGIGFICQAPSATEIRLARSSFSGRRDPQAGRDEAYVFVPGNPGTATGNSWVPLKITSVAVTAPCPGAQGPAITLTLSSSPSSALVEAGTPVRITELMELRQYRAEGRSWLGARSVSSGEAIQPLLGPLSETGGLELEYLDGTGAAITDKTGIKSIRVTLRGTAEAGGAYAPADEELITQVTLRNALAP
jgi:prepilin-type N-terminal cleavage/methylation domain-containing protein